MPVEQYKAVMKKLEAAIKTIDQTHAHYTVSYIVYNVVDDPNRKRERRGRRRKR